MGDIDQIPDKNYHIQPDRNNPMVGFINQLDGLHKQHKESAKYEDNVLDYNQRPLKDQREKQAQRPLIYQQIPPSVATQTLQAAEKFHNYASDLSNDMYVRNQVFTLLTIALVVFTIIFVLRTKNFFF